MKRLRVVILGGGTAGWMTAAALARHVGRVAEIELIESADIGIVGVGEATLPHLRCFVSNLGIDEAAFMAATEATYKLGIAFDDFGAIGERYVHPFGIFGRPIGDVPFHHFWLAAAQRDARRAGPIGTYALGVAAAEAGRFARPHEDGVGLESSYGYAYQFDATRFAPFLRDWAIARGVRRTEGRVVNVERDGGSGDVRVLVMENGAAITGDLFVDCSGFASLLLGGAFDEVWEDWSHWLPCDRAVAMPTESPPGEIRPYTLAAAMSAGWRWCIPLRHRVGNGYVFSSAHMSEDEACDALIRSVSGRPLADPRALRFRAGRRRRSWVRNVVGLGLSSGFLEPLESTSIYLTQMAISRLIDAFPLEGIDDADRVEFNRQVDMEYDRVRDFLILHYHATKRDDSDFWNHVRTMAVPDTLRDKMELWRRTARVEHYGEGLFLEPSWVAVYLGQGIIPYGYDPRADLPTATSLDAALAGLRKEVATRARAMPSHRDALNMTQEPAR